MRPCTDATAPRRHSPNRRRSAVPGPRPVAPHAVPGGPGHLRAFTFALAGWRILAPDGRHRGPRSVFASGAQAAAATRGRRSPRRPRARGRRRRLRDHLRPLLPRACSPSAGTCSAVARRRRTPCSTASPRRTGRCVAAAGDIDLRPWLYTIARNRCLSALRRAAPRSPSTRSRTAPVGRGHGGPGRAARRPARAGGRAAAPARGPARGAGPLRARRRVPRADRGRPRRAPGEGQGARLPGPRGADARARGARDSVRRDPRAARDRHGPGAAAQHRARRTSTAAPAARSSSARFATSAPRSRRSCPWCRPSA